MKNLNSYVRRYFDLDNNTCYHYSNNVKEYNFKIKDQCWVASEKKFHMYFVGTSKIKIFDTYGPLFNLNYFSYYYDKNGVI